MTGLRRAFLYLLIFLACLIGFERSSLGYENLASSTWLAIVLSLAAILLTLFIPVFNRPNPTVLAVFWAIIFLLSRLALQRFDSSVPVWGGIYTTATLTQGFIVAAAVLLAYNAGKRIQESEEAVRNVTLDGLKYCKQTLEEAYDNVEREFIRSSRHQYPLSVIVVEPDSHSVDLSLNRSVYELQKNMMTRYAISHLIRITSGQIRRTDLIIGEAGNRDGFVIFSPDTDDVNANILVERIRSAIEEQAGIKVYCGKATYPEEGQNYEDLVEVAGHRLQEERREPLKETA